MLELAILIPLSLWLIDQSIKGRAKNEEQAMAIRELAHSIDNVAHALAHHIETSEIRLESMNSLVDKIWSKLE